jgi:hypothetical protein
MDPRFLNPTKISTLLETRLKAEIFITHIQSCQLKNPKIKPENPEIFSKKKPENFQKKKPEKPEISGKNRKVGSSAQIISLLISYSFNLVCLQPHFGSTRSLIFSKLSE